MASAAPLPRYSQRVTVVTGGTRGIGRAVARLFVQNGARVVVCAKEEEAGDLERELMALGPGDCLYVPCDVTKESDIKRLIEVVVEKFGRLDCLINNAGWHPPEQRVDDTSAADFRPLLDLNLLSGFLTAKYALPHLRKTQGNIINLSSLVGVIGQNYAVPYVSTKGAVTAMTKAMAVDEAKHGVRVNCISPGNIWTPMWKELADESPDPAAMIQGGKDSQLIGRMGTPEECAQAALYLAAEGTFCTGIDLILSGGAELNYANKNQQRTRSSIYD
ncbi:LOW QUALITY PROTEIN: 17-beta-hydroxysteroid dehydrogenase 14 [Rhinatrema bivittatum]|uniref:LOW QUALITY PROTEIN: 17-beta-hydroxysteroid dehydrogenase 14 n=1 Tax=Rhinatrema bivittatum TaxID=194408 RepID=UPI0011274963|nr:LOW QUALITY PROTEIN: 17-beta-hydroxysteroid dehydrogenase 14 [Rhinatrema bivittatum]